MILILIFSLITLAYVILMLTYRKGWKRQKPFTIEEGYTPETKVSIIIPARNEEQNIKTCLDAILSQNYPKELLEVIVVDDHSTDGTAGIVRSYGASVKYIDLQRHIKSDEKVTAYKKYALAKGVESSSGELIVTTDADCYAGPDWIQSIVAMYQQEKPVMIVAPVDYDADKSVLQQFQSLDFMSMQGITAAALQLNLGNMSNGANLAFSRSAFEDVGGYEGVDHIASGDDYLLMMKMQMAYPSQISYLKSKSAIVKTQPQHSWGDFFQQRIRWASKSGKYDDKRLTLLLALVYIFNLSFLAALIGGFFYYPLFGVLICMFLVKTEIELIYLYPVSKFFGKTSQIITFAFYQPLHIAYIISAGLLGFIGVYRWKDRKVK